MEGEERVIIKLALEGHPLLVLSDRADIDSTRDGYLVAASEAIELGGVPYDMGLVLACSPMRSLGFYTIPISAVDTTDDDELAVHVADEFVRHKAKHCLVHTPRQDYPLLFTAGRDVRTRKVHIVNIDYETTTDYDLRKEGVGGRAIIDEADSLVERLMQLS